MTLLIDIFDASSKGDLNSIKDYIKNGGDINAKNSDGDTALMIAAYKDHADCIKFLIETKSDINVRNNEDFTAFMFAMYNIKKIDPENIFNIKNVKNIRMEIASMLLNAGAKEDIFDAVKIGDLDFINEYLKNGGDVNAIDKNNKTALMYVADRQYC